MSDVLFLAIVAVVLWVSWLNARLKSASEERFKALVERLDAIDQKLRAFEVDAKEPDSAPTAVEGPDESEEVFKDGWLATRAEHARHEEGLKGRRLSGEKALAIHGDLIAQAKRLCANEGLSCDEFGCPVPYRASMLDDSPAAKAKFDAAKRVAEAYRRILLDALKNAIGDELMSKLGEPEKYVYPQAGPGHEQVLAYCNLEFKRVDKRLFNGLPVPKSPEPGDRNEGIIPQDKNIAVSHTAGFGIFDPGYGEQYIPGDLRVIVGVKTVDEVTSYYGGWLYQINPTADNFLKAELLLGLRSDPNINPDRV